MAGRLLVVGTPIGNLGDLTPRAADALRSADLVVAEDTRMARRLLAHIGAKRPTVAFNDHAPASRLPELIARLEAGATLAFTTDAGMPGVSDPGATLVEAARGVGAIVEVLPGPSAVTAAIAASGVESLGFVFGGFLPPRPASARDTALRRLVDASGETGMPLVLFEAPHRVETLLASLEQMVPVAQVAACRELTKLHEQVLLGTPAEVAAMLTERRGEFTLVVSRIPRPALSTSSGSLAIDAVVEAALQAGLTSRTAVELLRAAGIPRREAYLAAKPPLSGD